MNECLEQGNKEDKDRKQELVFQLQEALQKAAAIVKEKESEKDGLQKVPAHACVRACARHPLGVHGQSGHSWK